MFNNWWWRYLIDIQYGESNSIQSRIRDQKFNNKSWNEPFRRCLPSGLFSLSKWYPSNWLIIVMVEMRTIFINHITRTSFKWMVAALNHWIWWHASFYQPLPHSGQALTRSLCTLAHDSWYFAQHWDRWFRIPRDAFYRRNPNKLLTGNEGRGSGTARLKTALKLLWSSLESSPRRRRRLLQHLGWNSCGCSSLIEITRVTGRR